MGVFQQKYETVSEDRVTLPEKDLWIAVLTRAVLDACKGPPRLDMTRKANTAHKSLYINITGIKPVIFLWRGEPTSEMSVTWLDEILNMSGKKLEKYY